MSDDIIKNMQEIRDKLGNKNKTPIIPSKSFFSFSKSSDKTSDKKKIKNISFSQLDKDIIHLENTINSYKLNAKMKGDEQKLKYVKEQLEMINKLPFDDKSKLEEISNVVNSLSNVNNKNLNELKEDVKVAFDTYIESSKNYEPPKQEEIKSTPPSTSQTSSPDTSTPQTSTTSTTQPGQQLSKRQQKKQNKVQFADGTNTTPAPTTPAPTTPAPTTATTTTAPSGATTPVTVNLSDDKDKLKFFNDNIVNDSAIKKNIVDTINGITDLDKLETEEKSINDKASLKAKRNEINKKKQEVKSNKVKIFEYFKSKSIILDHINLKLLLEYIKNKRKIKGIKGGKITIKKNKKRIKLTKKNKRL
jgi:hypothetical protein